MSMLEALNRTFLLCRDGDVIGKNTVTDDDLVAAFRDTRVVLVADKANLSAASGQHALVALFNLAARLGVSVSLAMPDVPIRGFQPPLRGSSLLEGLLDLGADLIPECMATEASPDGPADIALVLGDSSWSGGAEMAIRLTGTEWAGTTCPAHEEAGRWTGDFPVGALVAAGIAAPEVYKLVMRRLGNRLPLPLGAAMAPVERASVRVASGDTRTTALDLGDVDFVSGGAITNSALLTLLHLPDVALAARVIEPEAIDLSNLNRYTLARLSDENAHKVQVLAAWQRPGVQIEGVPLRYCAETRDRILPFSPHVMVGTDSIPARWEVQREWPKWMSVGATSHFLTITSSHEPGQSCAGCLHPQDDPDTRAIPTVGFVSYWAGLLLAVRLLRHVAGRPHPLAEQHVYSVPLQLSRKHAFWPMPVARRDNCPVSCLTQGQATGT